MKLLGHGYAATETTFAGTTAGDGYGQGGFKIRKVVAFCGGSTVAPNSSGGIVLQTGQSSNAIASTFVVLPYPRQGDGSSATAAAPLSVELEGFDISCNWFEAHSNEAAAGGWGIFVFGD